MNILLDTQTFLWIITDADELSDKAPGSFQHIYRMDDITENR